VTASVSIHHELILAVRLANLSDHKSGREENGKEMNCVTINNNDREISSFYDTILSGNKIDPVRNSSRGV
jgi:hypothetical protein